MDGLAEIVAQAAALGAGHGHKAGWGKLQHHQVLSALGIQDPGDHRYVIIAAYEDAHDIARAEADPAAERFMQPISRAHKLWLRRNLVNHASLAEMLRVPPQRIYQEAGHGTWPEPVIDRPRKQWHWWPHLEPVLACGGLRLPPDAMPPPAGPAPSWWGNMPAAPDFTYYLRANLMDFTRFAEEYNLDRPAIMQAGRYPDYPEPVINQRANYWYWWPDLDRFLVRHRDVQLAPKPATQHAAVAGRPADLEPGC